MSAAILNFVRRGNDKRDWSEQELAEFFRVADALTQAGRDVGTDRGLTDEGDPWFIFFRPETDEVIAHFARIDGQFIADASALAEPVRGPDLRAVLNEVAAHYTLVLPNRRRDNNLFVHPAAVLAALVATALLEVEEAKAQKGWTAGEGERGDVRGDGVRVTNGASNTSVPVVNPAGRAVSFNDSGLVGESPLNTGLLFSTIAAVMSLSAHVAGVDAAEATVAISGDPQSVDVGLADAPTPHPDDGTAVAEPLGPKLNWPHFDGAPRPDVSRGGERPDVDLTVENVVVSDIASGLPQADGGARLPSGSQVARDTTSDSPKDFAVHAKASPVEAAGRVPDPARAGSSESDGESAQGELTDQNPTKTAKAVEELLANGLFDFVAAIDQEQDVGDGASEDDGAAAEAERQQEIAEAAADLRTALDVPDEFAPSPSDLVMNGPSSGKLALTALAEFFERGAFETIDLFVRTADNAPAPGDPYGGLGENPPLLVAYDSSAALLDTFSFMPGVVFVDEDLLSPYTPVPDTAQFELELDNDATVSLLGFYSLDQAFA